MLARNQPLGQAAVIGLKPVKKAVLGVIPITQGHLATLGNLQSPVERIGDRDGVHILLFFAMQPFLGIFGDLAQFLARVRAETFDGIAAGARMIAPQRLADRDALGSVFDLLADEQRHRSSGPDPAAQFLDVQIEDIDVFRAVGDLDAGQRRLGKSESLRLCHLISPPDFW